MLFTNASANTSELHIFQDKSLDFCAVICLQQYGRGPALGGCRMLSYASMDVAVQEAMRLATVMSYKAALSELPHDGGKAVIMRSAHNENRHAVLQRFAQCVDSLHGKYITTIDSGTSQADMSILKQHTAFVTGYLTEDNTSNDPAFSTALGIFQGMQAAVKLTYGYDHLAALPIAIQGIGHVGYHLAKLLYQAGAQLTICDINSSRAEQCAAECAATVVAPEAIYAVPCAIFSPCALGQILNPRTVPQLQAKIIAGAANDQLAAPDQADALAARGILYIPDYLINAGGLIHLSLQHKTPHDIPREIARIAQRIFTLAEQAQSQRKTLFAITEAVAAMRLTAHGGIASNA